MEFLMGHSVWVYLFIFFGKILEVTIATLRMVLINRGERTKGSIIAFFEISIWLVVTATVLTGFTSDFLKVIIFACAFSIGNYLGSWLEGKLAFGLSTIQVISSQDECMENMLELLREKDIGVTVMEGDGKEGKRKILLIHLKRKRIPEAIKIIQGVSKECVITVSDVKAIRGGYIKK